MIPLLHEFSFTRCSSSSEYFSAHSTILQYRLQVVFSTPENFPDLTVSYHVYYTSKLTTRYFQLQTCMAFCIKNQLWLCLDLSQTRRTTLLVKHVEGMNFIHLYADWIKQRQLRDTYTATIWIRSTYPLLLNREDIEVQNSFLGGRTSICMPASNTQHQGLFEGGMCGNHDY